MYGAVSTVFCINVFSVVANTCGRMTLQPRLHLARMRHFLMDAATQVNRSLMQSQQFDHGRMLAFQQGRLRLGFRHTVM